VLVCWRRRFAASDNPHRVFDAVAQLIAETGILTGRRKADEQWPNGSLRPPVEDLWGCWAYLEALCHNSDGRRHERVAVHAAAVALRNDTAITSRALARAATSCSWVIVSWVATASSNTVKSTQPFGGFDRAMGSGAAPAQRRPKAAAPTRNAPLCGRGQKLRRRAPASHCCGQPRPLCQRLGCNRQRRVRGRWQSRGVVAIGHQTHTGTPRQLPVPQAITDQCRKC
jgi:hypothetical protein